MVRRRVGAWRSCQVVVLTIWWNGGTGGRAAVETGRDAEPTRASLLSARRQRCHASPRTGDLLACACLSCDGGVRRARPGMKLDGRPQHRGHVGRNIGWRWPCSSALPGTVRHHVQDRCRAPIQRCCDTSCMARSRFWYFFHSPPPLHFFAQAAGAQRRLPAASRLIISFQSQAPSTAGTGPRKNAMARLG